MRGGELDGPRPTLVVERVDGADLEPAPWAARAGTASSGVRPGRPRSANRADGPRSIQSANVMPSSTGDAIVGIGCDADEHHACGQRVRRPCTRQVGAFDRSGAGLVHARPQVHSIRRRRVEELREQGRGEHGGAATLRSGRRRRRRSPASTPSCTSSLDPRGRTSRSTSPWRGSDRRRRRARAAVRDRVPQPSSTMSGVVERAAQHTHVGASCRRSHPRPRTAAASSTRPGRRARA